MEKLMEKLSKVEKELAATKKEKVNAEAVIHTKEQELRQAREEVQQVRFSKAHQVGPYL